MGCVFPSFLFQMRLLGTGIPSSRICSIGCRPNSDSWCCLTKSRIWRPCWCHTVLSFLLIMLVTVGLLPTNLLLSALIRSFFRCWKMRTKTFLPDYLLMCIILRRTTSWLYYYLCFNVLCCWYQYYPCNFSDDFRVTSRAPINGLRWRTRGPRTSAIYLRHIKSFNVSSRRLPPPRKHLPSSSPQRKSKC